MSDALDRTADPHGRPTRRSARGSACARHTALGTERPSESHGFPRRWHAEVVDGLDKFWEDDGDLVTLPLQPSADQRQQPQEEEEKKAGLGEAVTHHLPSRVNGLPVKTLVLRSLPAGVTLEQLLQCLPKPDVAKYNLLHVPQQRDGAHTPSIAFLNFESHENAVAFCGEWHGRKVQIPVGNTNSSVIEIEAAKHQGLVVNLFRWRTRMSGLNDPARLPAVFRGGQRQDFWKYVNDMQNFVHGRRFERDGATYVFHC